MVVFRHGSAAARGLASVESVALGCISAAVDVMPRTVRYGRGRALWNRLLWTEIPVLEGARPLDKVPEVRSANGLATSAVLMTGAMDAGGVEAVVETLALGLPRYGVSAKVMCSGAGRTAQKLRDSGIEVVVVESRHSAGEYLSTLSHGTVAQLHNAPEFMVEACGEISMPTVRVLHNTDVNLTQSGWVTEARLAKTLTHSIAVSQTVRDFYLQHLPIDDEVPIEVIPNGVDPDLVSGRDRLMSRVALSQCLGVDCRDSIVFMCLARYDLQKNIPGLVSSFLGVVDQVPNARLVVAGPPVDWLELRWAQALCRAHPAGGRVHFLGTSSSPELLAASDVFLLDSFFEGWPVAVTEAAVAGLPVLISDVGGGRELVGDHGERGELFANPAGDAKALTLGMIRRSRQRSHKQANARAVQAAVVRVCESIEDWRARRTSLAADARAALSSSHMIQSHAELLRRVASVGPGEGCVNEGVV